MKFTFITPDSHCWLETIHKLPHDSYHLPEYVALNASYEKGDAYAYVMEDGSNIFFFPFIIRPISLAFHEMGDSVLYDAISPYGYSSPLLLTEDTTGRFCQKAMSTFLAEMKRRNVVAVFSRLHPLLTNHEMLNGYGTLVNHGSTVSIDLTLSEGELWQQMRRNHRAGIKRTGEKGYSAFVDYEGKYWEQFIAIYYETMERNKADQYYYFSARYFEKLRQAMRECMYLGVVLDQGEVASAGLFTESNGIVQYHLSATADKYLKGGSSKLLLYFITLYEKKRGSRILHIGGGIGGNEDSLFRFKAGFSQTRHAFYTWHIIVNEGIYSQLVSEWEQYNGKKADDICDYFPVYRKDV
ncbi:MAG: hypothetical protein ABFC84_17900 [Veillonellales bacterium]